jgi:hypothetical protein
MDGKSIPQVIHFAFSDFLVDGDKIKAKCVICKAVLCEKKGTTSTFTR